MRITSPDDIGKTAFIVRKNRVVKAKITTILVAVETEGGDEVILSTEGLFARHPVNLPGNLEDPKTIPTE